MLQYIHIQSVFLFLHQGEIEFCNYEKKERKKNPGETPIFIKQSRRQNMK